MSGSRNWQDPDFDDWQAGSLPVDTQDRASQSLRSPDFQRQAPKVVQSAPATPTPEAPAAPEPVQAEAPRPSVSSIPAFDPREFAPEPRLHQRMVSDTAEAAVQKRDQALEAQDQSGYERFLRDSGVETQVNPSGHLDVTTHDDGSPKFKTLLGDPEQDESGRWVRKFRDDRGATRNVDILGSRQYHTDAATGDQYIKNAAGEPVIIGRDETVAQRKQLLAQRKALTLDQQREQLGLQQAKADLEPLKEKVKPLRKTYEILKKVTDNLKGGVDPMNVDQDAYSRWQAADSRLTEWKRQNKAWIADHDALTKGEQQVDEMQQSLRDRRSKILDTMADPQQAQRVAAAPEAAGIPPTGVTHTEALRQTLTQAAQQGDPKSAETLKQLEQSQKPPEVQEASSAMQKVANTPLTAGDKWDDIVSRPSQLVPFLGGAKELYAIGKVGLAAKRLKDAASENTEPSQEDVQMVREYVEHSQRDTTFGNKVVSIIAALPAFAGELLITDGIYTAGQKAALKGGAKALEVFGTKAGAELLGKLAARVEARAAGEAVADVVSTTAKSKVAELGARSVASLAGSALQTIPASAFRIGTDTVERMLPQFQFGQGESGQLTATLTKQGDDFVPAMTKALGNQFTEVFSERSGEALKFIPGAEKLAAMKASLMGRYFKQVPGATPSRFLETLKKAGWNGVLGEMFEERVGDVSKSAMGLQSWKDAIPSGEQLLTEFTGFALGGAAMHGAAKGVSALMGQPEAPKPATDQYRDLYQATQDMRAKAQTAYDAGDQVAGAKLSDNIEAAERGLGQMVGQMHGSLPEGTQALLARAVSPEADPAAPTQLLGDNPSARFAAIEVGQSLRSAYLTPEREQVVSDVIKRTGAPDAVAQTLVDTHVAMQATKDIRTVLEGGPIDQQKAEALTQLGLLQPMDNGQGGVTLMVTDDALPLLPPMLREKIKANPDALKFTVTPGNPGDVYRNLVQGGQRRVADAAGIAQTQQKGAPTEEGGQDYRVKVSFSLPNGAGNGETVLPIKANSEQEAIARAGVIGQKGGRKVLDAQIQPSETAPEPTPGKGPKDKPSSKQTWTPQDPKELSDPARKAVALVRKEFARNRKLFAALGITNAVTVLQSDRERAGLAVAGNQILLDGELLAEQVQTLESQGVSAQEWAQEALTEELIHRAQMVSVRDWVQYYEALWNDPSLPAELKEAAANSYESFDSLTDSAKGAEVVRMVIQGRWRERITERIFKAIQHIVDYLKGLKIESSPMLEDAIKRTEAVLAYAQGKVEQEAKLTNADDVRTVSRDESSTVPEGRQPAQGSADATTARDDESGRTQPGDNQGGTDSGDETPGPRGEVRGAVAGDQKNSETDAEGDSISDEEAARLRDEFENERLAAEEEALRGAGFVPLAEAIQSFGGLPSKNHKYRKNYSGEIARLLDAIKDRNRLARKGQGMFVGKMFSERAYSPDELATKLGFETPYDLFDALEREIANNRPEWIHPEALRETGLNDETALGASKTAQTKTPEFKEWFGNSKVRGVVYHQTASDFTSFDTTRGDLGSHFGTAEQARNSRGGRFSDYRPGSRTIPVYLKIESPLRLKDTGSFHAWAIQDQLLRKGIISKQQASEFAATVDGTVADRKTANQRAKDAIEAAGFDGVVYSNSQEGKGDSYIAFRPTQIKSAIGNSGAFDATNPSILAASKAKHTGTGDLFNEESTPRKQALTSQWQRLTAKKTRGESLSQAEESVYLSAEQEMGQQFLVDMQDAKGSADTKTAEQRQIQAGQQRRLVGSDTSSQTDIFTGRPEADRNGQEMLFSSKNDGFYSQLERTVDSKMPNRASADQVRGILDPAKGSGVKKEELEWLGLPQYLEGKQVVSKPELLQFIRENTVPIGEVVKGSNAEQAKRKLREARDEVNAHPLSYRAMEAGLNRLDAMNLPGRLTDGRVSVQELPEGLQQYATEYLQAYRNYEALKADSEKAGEPPKFSQYALPGGENYREVLLTLPETKVRKPFEQWLSENLGPGFEDNSSTREMYSEQVEPGTLFRSGHWDETNVLAHIRQADFTDSYGAKVRVIEEIQSDWHQAGRKEGYDNESAFEKLIAERDKAADDSPEQEELQRQIDEMGRTGSKGVPNAPFKKSWHELAFKKALLSAVEDGADKLAWVTGDIAASRFDLSEQVDDLRVGPSGDPSRGKYFIEGYKDGENVVADWARDEAKLSDMIGKEMAEKIVSAGAATQKVSFKGDQLKVGGHGMRGFYDKIIPDFARKYIKPWGGKVEAVEVPNGEIAKQDRFSQRWYLTDDGPNFETREEAEASAPSVKLHGFTLTSGIIDAVRKGQALFASHASGSAVGRAPSQTSEQRGTESQQPEPPEARTAAARQGLASGENNRGSSTGQAAKSAAELVKENVGLAVAIAGDFRNIPGVDLEDVVGNARQALVMAARSFDPEQGAPFSGYARRVIKNRLIDLYRKESGRAQIESGSPLAEETQVTGPNVTTEGISARETQQAVRDALAMLADRPRQILQMRMAGASLSEIGEQFNVSKQAINAVEQAGLKKLREMMMAQGFKGVDSDGMLYSSKQTKTPEFKAWFGDSKVVDEQGNPKVMYHGSNTEFNVFKSTPDAHPTRRLHWFASQVGEDQESSTPNGVGIFGARWYGKNVKAVYIKIERPYPRGDVAELHAEKIGPDELRRMGYDGFIDTWSGSGFVAVLDPSQIKSATDNSGAFSPTADDILHTSITADPALTQAQIDKEADRIENPTPADQTQSAEGPSLWRDVYNTHLRGRIDKLAYFAPGTENVVLDSQRQQGLVTASLREFMERIDKGVRESFGNPTWWKNKAALERLSRFKAKLLPVAARLNATDYDQDGNFQFEFFWQRAGDLGIAKAKAQGVGEGDWVDSGNGDMVRVGKYLSDLKSYQLERPITPATQQRVYEDFQTEFPESAHWLDSFIAPKEAKSRVVDERNVRLPTFNRFSLQDFYGESPYGNVGRVEGYTPDVTRTKSIAGMVGSLLKFDWTSPGRKRKTGEGREHGQIRNLFEGFSIRAAQAHEEKMRRDTAEQLLKTAVKDIPAGFSSELVDTEAEANAKAADWRAAGRSADVEPSGGKWVVRSTAKGLPPGYVRLDQDFFNPLIRAAHAAGVIQDTGELLLLDEQLTDESVADPESEASLDKRVLKANIEMLTRLVGDPTLFSPHKMVRKEVAAEIVRQFASTRINNRFLAVMDGLVRRMTTGYLAHPFSWIQNLASNEVFRSMRIMQRFSYGILSKVAGNKEEGAVALREARYLMQGALLDRFWNKSQRRLMDAVVPLELFERNNGLRAIAGGDMDQSAAEQIRRLNVPGAILKAVHYGDMDGRAKQQLAFAAYRAHGEQALSDAQKAGTAPATMTAKEKQDWLKKWVTEQPEEFHRKVYASTVLYALDYANVPALLDEGTRVEVRGVDITPLANMARRLAIPFGKYPYNYARQIKRLGVDSLLDVTLRRKFTTKAQKVEAAANLAMLSMLFVGARVLIGLGDDDDISNIGTSYDEEGNLLESAFNTGSRVNLSGTMLGPIVQATARMFGDTEAEKSDYWLRVRTLPYANIGLMLAGIETSIERMTSGKDTKSKEALGDNIQSTFEDFVSTGLGLKLGLALVGYRNKYEQNLPLGVMLGQSSVDLGTGGVAPSALLRSANTFIDPVARRVVPSKSINYDPGFIEGALSKVPLATKILPPAGRVVPRIGADNPKAQEARAKLAEQGLEKFYTEKPNEKTGKIEAAYPNPDTIKRSPRWQEAARFAGLNVKGIDREKYRREVKGIKSPLDAWFNR